MFKNKLDGIGFPPRKWKLLPHFMTILLYFFIIYLFLMCRLGEKWHDDEFFSFFLFLI